MPPTAPVCFILCHHSLAFRLICPFFFFLMRKFLLPISTLYQSQAWALHLPPRVCPAFSVELQGLMPRLSSGFQDSLWKHCSWGHWGHEGRLLVDPFWHSLGTEASSTICPTVQEAFMLPAACLLLQESKRGVCPRPGKTMHPLSVLEGWLATCC